VVAAPERPSRVGLPVYIVLGVCLLGAGLFAYIEYGRLRTPNQTTRQVPLSPEAKAYVGNLHLSDVSMKATQNYALQTVVEIEGKIANAGNRSIETVEIYCYFFDSYGQLVFRPRVAIVTTRMGGLKPSETKAFRLPFDEIPPGWNQTMPQMVIAGVKFQS
jgi:hypothetical protein